MPELNCFRFALLACVVFVGCGDSSKIVPDSVVLDAGPVFLEPASQQDWYVSKDFSVTNSTPFELEITEIAKSCGCTSVQLKSTTIAPGDAISGVVRMYLRYKRESRSEVAIMHCKTIDRSFDISVTLKCDVFPRLFFTNSRNAEKIVVDKNHRRDFVLEAVGYSAMPVSDNQIQFEIDNGLGQFSAADPVTKVFKVGPLFRYTRSVSIDLGSDGISKPVLAKAIFGGKTVDFKITSDSNSSDQNKKLYLSNKKFDDIISLDENAEIFLVRFDEGLVVEPIVDSINKYRVKLASHATSSEVKKLFFKRDGELIEVDVFILAN